MNRGLVVFSQIVFSLFLLTSSAAVIAEELHQWETAIVIAQKLSSGPPGLLTMTVDTGGGNRYEWQESTDSPNWHPFAVRTAHDQVKFYRDGQWFVVLDSQGNKHKFSLVRTMKFE